MAPETTDISALVAQMQATLSAIHDTLTSSLHTPTAHHEAQLDELERKRDDAIRALGAAFAAESEFLARKRRAERDAITEARRKEDEELARKRREEDERLVVRDREEDEARDGKLREDSEAVEEETDRMMGVLEEEARRAVEGGRERLRGLQERRRELNRLIEEQLELTLPKLPVVTTRPRRGTKSSVSSFALPADTQRSEPSANIKSPGQHDESEPEHGAQQVEAESHEVHAASPVREDHAPSHVPLGAAGEKDLSEGPKQIPTPSDQVPDHQSADADEGETPFLPQSPTPRGGAPFFEPVHVEGEVSDMAATSDQGVDVPRAEGSEAFPKLLADKHEAPEEPMSTSSESTEDEGVAPGADGSELAEEPLATHEDLPADEQGQNAATSLQVTEPEFGSPHTFGVPGRTPSPPKEEPEHPTEGSVTARESQPVSPDHDTLLQHPEEAVFGSPSSVESSLNGSMKPHSPGPSEPASHEERGNARSPSAHSDEETNKEKSEVSHLEGSHMDDEVAGNVQDHYPGELGADETEVEPASHEPEDLPSPATVPEPLTISRQKADVDDRSSDKESDYGDGATAGLGIAVPDAVHPHPSGQDDSETVTLRGNPNAAEDSPTLAANTNYYDEIGEQYGQEHVPEATTSSPEFSHDGHEERGGQDFATPQEVHHAAEDYYSADDTDADSQPFVTPLPSHQSLRAVSQKHGGLSPDPGVDDYLGARQHPTHEDASPYELNHQHTTTVHGADNLFDEDEEEHEEHSEAPQAEAEPTVTEDLPAAQQETPVLPSSPGLSEQTEVLSPPEDFARSRSWAEEVDSYFEHEEELEREAATPTARDQGPVHSPTVEGNTDVATSSEQHPPSQDLAPSRNDLARPETPTGHDFLSPSTFVTPELTPLTRQESRNEPWRPSTDDWTPQSLRTLSTISSPPTPHNAALSTDKHEPEPAIHGSRVAATGSPRRHSTLHLHHTHSSDEHKHELPTSPKSPKSPKSPVSFLTPWQRRRSSEIPTANPATATTTDTATSPTSGSGFLDKRRSRASEGDSGSSGGGGGGGGGGGSLFQRMRSIFEGQQHQHQHARAGSSGSAAVTGGRSPTASIRSGRPSSEIQGKSYSSSSPIGSQHSRRFSAFVPSSPTAIPTGGGHGPGYGLGGYSEEDGDRSSALMSMSPRLPGN